MFDDEGAVEAEEHDGGGGVHDCDSFLAVVAADAEADAVELDVAAAVDELDADAVVTAAESCAGGLGDSVFGWQACSCSCPRVVDEYGPVGSGCALWG